MKVFTCISDVFNPAYKKVLLKSCDYFQLDLNTQIISISRKWISHREKDIQLYDFLSTCKKDEIVLFSDGYDTCFLADEIEIVEKYRSLNSDIVISAEINCHPNKDLEAFYPHQDSKYRFINSGGFIGTAKSIMKVIESFRGIKETEDSKKYEWSNQYLWTIAYIEQTVSIKLDAKCSIFQTLSSERTLLKQILETRDTDYQMSKALLRQHKENIFGNFKYEGGRIYNINTESTPAHIHFSSPVLKKAMFEHPFVSLYPWLLEK